MRLTEKDIKEINSKVEDSWNNGIFKEPYGIPNGIKDLVIYSRIETGGYSGGNCWGGISEAYTCDNDFNYDILDLVIEKLKPTCTFMEYRKIQKSLIESEYSDREYYGNSTEFRIKYITLENLYTLLGI